MKNLLIYGVVIAGSYLFYSFTEADRNETGAIVSEGNVDAFSIRVGDCFNDEDDFVEEESVEITGVAGVPCSQAHDNEVYALVNLTMNEFPGDEEISDLAFDSCMAKFEGFVGLDYESSILDIFTLYPTVESWAQNDREVVCAIYDMNLEKLEGSARGLAI